MLKKGTLINIKNSSNKVKIIETLGEGGQGTVYLVNYDGDEYALKWYHNQYLEEIDSTKFYDNLENNIRQGAPTKAENLFLWPLLMTELYQGSFGYLMELRDPNFVELSKILTADVKCSMNKRVKASLLFISAYRALYNTGYSYQDLNDGNFFINPDTGDIKICDNDNVCQHGKDAGIKGKPGYMAPEIVTGALRAPNAQTDKHSLAVILYRMLCSDDPFIGERVGDYPCLTEKASLFLYGENPLFIFDPDDDSNKPIHGVHNDSLAVWPYLPKYLQNTFVDAFRIGVKDPNKRVEYLTWQKVFLRLKGNMLVCPKCGTEDYLIKEYCDIKKKKFICPNCNSEYPIPLVLKGKYCSLPLFLNAKLYNAHIHSLNSIETDILDKTNILGEVIANKKHPEYWGIRNLSKDTWYVTKTNGEVIQVLPNKVVLIENGVKISIAGNALEIVNK